MFQGYTIPLDKRLAADGRGLQTVHINENFAKLAEALYIADRKVFHLSNVLQNAMHSPFYPAFKMWIVSVGQRGSGDESPGGEEDGTEGEGKEGGEAEGTGPNGQRPQGRNQESWGQR